MAITEVPEYAHLSDADVAALAAELDTIRCDIEESRGSKDREYIRRAIAFQRGLEVAARLTILASKTKVGWITGTVALAVAKCIENMELAHNITHGQWDWMNDPEIHSATWEWDMVGPSSHWRSSHNHLHHKFTNVVGMDDDLGFGVMRVTRDQEWRPSNLLQPLRAVLLATAFEWGVAMHGLYAVQDRETTEAGKSAHTKDDDPQDGPPSRQGLCSLSCFEPRAVASHTGSHRGGQRASQWVGLHRHRLRALRRRRGEVHRVGLGGRDKTGVVSAANAG